MACHREYWTWESPSNPHNKKPYLRALESGALVTFKVKVGAMGRVRVTFLRAGSYGLGKAWCWVGPLPPTEPKEGENWKWDGWDVGRDKGRLLNAFWKLQMCVTFHSLRKDHRPLGQKYSDDGGHRQWSLTWRTPIAL